MNVTHFALPFRHWIVNDFLSPALVEEAGRHIPPESWDAWVRYSNEIEHRKRTSRDLIALGAQIADLFAALAGMLGKLKELTGIDDLQNDPYLHGAGIHVTDPGGWLAPHADYEVHPQLPGKERRLSVVLGLNSDWQQSWGGETLLFDTKFDSFASVCPAFNQALLFENSATSYHGVRPTAHFAAPRITAAYYLLAGARPSACRTRAMFLPNRNSPNPPKELG